MPDVGQAPRPTGQQSQLPLAYARRLSAQIRAARFRLPCAMNNLTGIKPTWGRVSVHGVFGLAPSMDHLGTMARTAADAGQWLQVIAGPDPNDPMSRRDPVPEFVSGEPDVRGMRLGIDVDVALNSVASEVATVVDGVAQTMESLCAEICRVNMPSMELLAAGFGNYCCAEANVAHEATFPARAAEYGPILRSFLEQGQGVTAIEMARIERERLLFAGGLASLFEDVDLLLVPVLETTGRELTPVLDIPQDQVANFVRCTAPFNFSGNPTITMPGGRGDDGTSIAFQFVAPSLCEERLVTAGRAFQRETDWHLARPSC